MLGAVLLTSEPCTWARSSAIGLGAVLLGLEPCSWARSRDHAWARSRDHAWARSRDLRLDAVLLGSEQCSWARSSNIRTRPSFANYLNSFTIHEENTKKIITVPVVLYLIKHSYACFNYHLFTENEGNYITSSTYVLL